MTRNNYFRYMSTLFLALVLIGFARSLYMRSYFDSPELSPHLYLHGIALTAWFVLAFVQPWLIKSGRIELHRRFGLAAAAVAVAEGSARNVVGLIRDSGHCAGDYLCPVGVRGLGRVRALVCVV